MAPPKINDTILVAYADGELDPNLTGLVEAEMKSDPAVRERIMLFHESRELIKAAMTEVELPAMSENLKRIAGRLSMQSRVRKVSYWALPIAAAIVGFVVGAIEFRGYFTDPTFVGASVQTTTLNLMLEDIVEDHFVYVRAQEPLTPQSGPSTQRIEAWISGRIDLPIKAPSLKERGFEFVGSRVMAIEGAPLFELIYEDDKNERIGIGIRRDKSRSASNSESIEDRGIRAIGRKQDGYLYVVVGPAGHPLIEPLGQTIVELMRDK
jgi:anti-sigma factor RsiW